MGVERKGCGRGKGGSVVKGRVRYRVDGLEGVW